ncbi:P-II family nitrogen regulator [Thiocapsa bogorovii]|uniref:P-II family nitrogen regulator n=1 Tax=Thiocapsa bogorovii TaxID=521689 RepID=UPI001E40B55A|nr:transcriptional regulator [Thiocapsa bogorovii]UHD14778.1 transcriptional regulator [Thiocapsa bogorovii]
MHRLVPEKLVTVITTDVLEHRLVAAVSRRGASGYTLLRARGAGSDGLQSGNLEVDTNLLLKVILPPDRMSDLLDDLDALIGQGYHLTVFVSDVAVLNHEKFERPLEP